jgi:hypothetical protein
MSLFALHATAGPGSPDLYRRSRLRVMQYPGLITNQSENIVNADSELPTRSGLKMRNPIFSQPIGGVSDTAELWARDGLGLLAGCKRSSTQPDLG